MELMKTLKVAKAVSFARLKNTYDFNASTLYKSKIYMIRPVKHFEDILHLTRKRTCMQDRFQCTTGVTELKIYLKYDKNDFKIKMNRVRYK